MRLKLFVTLFFVFCSSVIFSQVKEDNMDDPFDVSSISKKIDELGVPTVENVQALKDTAYSLFSSGQWEEAAEALNLFSKNANWIANLITSGLEPYYNASYDKQKDMDYSVLKSLVPIENLANTYKKNRNEAMVMEAECYIKLNKKAEAVGILNNALDVINLDHDILWERARKDLYDILGVQG